MSSLDAEYQSDFARRCVAQGRAEGRLECWVDVILKLVAFRFGPLTEATQTRIRKAQGAQLYAVLERMMTEQTVEEVLGPLY